MEAIAVGEAVRQEMNSPFATAARVVDDGRLDTSAERITVNETLSRRVNEGIENGRRERDGFVPFVCECGILGCNEIVELTLAEYELVRSGGRRFLVAPGHGADFDVVQSGGERFDVIRKPEGPLGDYADRTDPRRGG